VEINAWRSTNGHQRPTLRRRVARTIASDAHSESKEPDAEVARRVAKDGCILRSVVGSTVHELSNPRHR